MAIVSNGALVWDVAADDTHLVRPIPVDVGREVCALIRAAVPGSAFARGVDRPASRWSRPSSSATPCPTASAVARWRRSYDAPALKMLARHEELDAHEFWRRAETAVGERATITWSSASSLLEISAAGVTKASTLALLCEGLGVARTEVVAFGDMPNDLAMLEWAGTAYAMANAHPSVLAVADHVAPSHDDDGVAVVLEGLLGGG